MKVSELLEAEEKKSFEVSFRQGTNKRKQKFTQISIVKCKVFSHAEIRRILKLQLNGTLNTSFEDDSGRTMVQVKRTK